MPSSLVWLGRLHDRVTDLGMYLSQVALGLILLAYNYEIVARYFFSAPTSWANEVVSYGLCVGCFLMMPHVTRTRGHVAVSLILDWMSADRAARWDRMLLIGSAVVCAIATWICLEESIRQFTQDVYLMRVHPIPKVYISIWIAYGFASSAIHFMRLAVERPVGADAMPEAGR